MVTRPQARTQNEASCGNEKILLIVEKSTKVLTFETTIADAYLIPLPQLLNYFRAHGMYLTKGKGPVDRIPLPIYMTPAEVAQNQLYAPQKVTYPDYTPGTYQKQTVISKVLIELDSLCSLPWCEIGVKNLYTLNLIPEIGRFIQRT